MRSSSLWTLPSIEWALKSAEVFAGTTGFDVPAVGGELIVAARAEIAVVEDLSTATAGPNKWSGNGLHRNGAADRGDFHVAVAHIAERDGPTNGRYVDMSVADVVNVDDGVGAFEGEVSLEILGRQRASRRAQVEGSVGRNLKLVVDASGLRIGAGRAGASRFQYDCRAADCRLRSCRIEKWR